MMATHVSVRHRGEAEALGPAALGGDLLVVHAGPEGTGTTGLSGPALPPTINLAVSHI